VPGADAATRFVRKSGSDGGNAMCAQASPCATIAHAVAVASAGDTINIGTGTFVEVGAIFINKNLVLEGRGLFRTHVLGSAWVPSTVFQIGTNANVTIRRLQVRKGQMDLGGGIRNHGTLRLEDVWIRNNRADSGGGIYNDGLLVLTRVEVALNTAEGLFNSPAGTAIVTQSRIAANDTTGVTNVLGTVLVRDSTVVANGSGLTRVGLTAGIESVGGNLGMTNVTVSGNHGTAVHVNDAATAILTHVTISDNEVLGLIAGSGAQVELWNSIIAGNHATADCLTGGAGVTGSGNLLGNVDCMPFPIPGNIFDVDPELGPLAPNGGGGLWTHVLKHTSPAIDAGLPDRCVTPDQRGVARPTDGDGDGTAQCDMGAYEFVGPGPDRGRGRGDTGR